MMLVIVTEIAMIWWGSTRVMKASTTLNLQMTGRVATILQFVDPLDPAADYANQNVSEVYTSTK